MFTGNLLYKEIEFTFVFDGEELRLIPPKDKYREIRHKWNRIEINKSIYAPNNPLIMEDPFLSGINVESNQQIIFIAKPNSYIGDIDGVLYIEIPAYMIFKADEIGKINGLCFYSPEINRIYDSHKAIEIKFDELLKQNGSGKVSINTEFSNKYTSTKQIFYADDKEVQVYFGIKKRLNFKLDDPPLVLNSCMYFNFNATDDYNFILQLWFIAKKFISFLCYRQNVSFPIVDIYTSYEHNPHFTCGTLHVLKESGVTDIESLEKNEFIKYEYIAGNEGKILSDIAQNTLYSRHIPKSHYEKTCLDESRFIMITSAFEWEFRRNYPNGIKKSKKTIEIEEKATCAIQNLMNNSTGKLKEKYKFLKRKIKSDSLQSEIIQVGKDYFEIIDIFGQRLYSLNNETLNYSEMGERVAKQRNHFAHGDLDKEFINTSLSDIIFLEYIIYAMQLKMFGISDENIIKAIADLFHINLPF